jgi:predicted DNA-binding protein
MSDMASDRITVRLAGALGDRLRYRSRSEGRTESDLIRQAIENYLGQSNGNKSAYALAEESGLIGCVSRAPKDLSRASRHMEGFGK